MTFLEPCAYCQEHSDRPHQACETETCYNCDLCVDESQTRWHFGPRTGMPIGLDRSDPDPLNEDEA